MEFFSSEPTDYILQKALAGERISPSEALCLYQEADFLKVQTVARELRKRRTNPHAVSYTIFQVVNYTTFCNVDCNFCSFYESYNSPRGKTLSPAEIVEKMRSAVKLGANQMFLQGGVDERIPFDYYLEVLETIKKEFGEAIHIRAFSPVELLGIEKISKMPLKKVLRELKAAGMDSVPGAGAEILSERVRRILSPKKASAKEWVRVMESCHEEGLPGSANIVFGSEESQAEVIEHLEIVRNIQDRTGSFLSFIPWTFQQQTRKFRVRTVSAPEFLKVLGICRIFLDNIKHIESSLMVLGSSIGALTLQGGADDISSVVLEENVLRSYGLKSEVEARTFIQENGFQAVYRNLLYETHESKQKKSQSKKRENIQEGSHTPLV